MVDDQGGELRVVAWTEMFPWLILARAFRLAIGFRLLLLSAVAISVTITGWMAFGHFLLDRTESTEQIDQYGWLAVTRAVPSAPTLPGEPGSTAIERCVEAGRQAADD